MKRQAAHAARIASTCVLVVALGCNSDSKPKSADQNAPDAKEQSDQIDLSGTWNAASGDILEFFADKTYTSDGPDGSSDKGKFTFPDSTRADFVVLESVPRRSKIGVQFVYVTPNLVKMVYESYPPSPDPDKFQSHIWPPATFAVRSDDDGDFPNDAVQLAKQLQRRLEMESTPTFQFISPDADGSNPLLITPEEAEARSDNGS